MEYTSVVTQKSIKWQSKDGMLIKNIKDQLVIKQMMTLILIVVPPFHASRILFFTMLVLKMNKYHLFWDWTKKLGSKMQWLDDLTSKRRNNNGLCFSEFLEIYYDIWHEKVLGIIPDSQWTSIPCLSLSRQCGTLLKTCCWFHSAPLL